MVVPEACNISVHFRIPPIKLLSTVAAAAICRPAAAAGTAAVAGPVAAAGTGGP